MLQKKLKSSFQSSDEAVNILEFPFSEKIVTNRRINVFSHRSNDEESLFSITVVVSHLLSHLTASTTRLRNVNY